MKITILCHRTAVYPVDYSVSAWNFFGEGGHPIMSQEDITDRNPTQRNSSKTKQNKTWISSHNPVSQVRLGLREGWTRDRTGPDPAPGPVSLHVLALHSCPRLSGSHGTLYSQRGTHTRIPSLKIPGKVSVVRWGQMLFPGSVGCGTARSMAEPAEPQLGEERGGGALLKALDALPFRPVFSTARLTFQWAWELLAEFVKMQVPEAYLLRFWLTGSEVGHL